MIIAFYLRKEMLLLDKQPKESWAVSDSILKKVTKVE
jgi:hypothetical protein